MKIKSGFVSNSSSSSFVIVTKDNQPPCPCCNRRYPNVIDRIENFNHFNDDNRVLAIGKDDIIEYIKQNWYSDYAKDAIKKILTVSLDKGEQIALVQVSYHDDELNDLVKQQKIIISDEN